MEQDMKREITPPPRGLVAAYRLAAALALALVLALAAGSLYALVRPKDSPPLFRIGGKGPGARDGAQGPANIFSGIGRLRIPRAGEPPSTVIISISFPYPAEDRPFAEELASRIGDFRAIASEYFAALPPEKMGRLDEDAAKKEILRQYNALLRLGRIETLYFGDFMVIE